MTRKQAHYLTVAAIALKELEQADRMQAFTNGDHYAARRELRAELAFGAIRDYFIGSSVYGGDEIAGEVLALELGYQALELEPSTPAESCRPDTEQLEQEAAELGAEHGTNAASWFIAGDWTTHTYRRVYAGIMDGDPMILDSFPSSPLSGEYAGSMTPAALYAELGMDDDDDAGDDICRAYEEAFDSAVHSSIEQECATYLHDNT